MDNIERWQNNKHKKLPIIGPNDLLLESPEDVLLSTVLLPTFGP